MHFTPSIPPRPARARGFSLVELLAVIAIVSILMTVGAIGVGAILNGKGTTSGVASAESVFAEARAVAVGKQTRARVLVDVANQADANNYLRRILVAYEELDSSGRPKEGEWVISGRAVILPDRTYFSRDFSKKNQEEGGLLDTMTLTNVNRNFAGDYLYYEFNSEGICTMPGASFILGSGGREHGADRPRVTASTKKDFGGFIIWRNGRTSLFRSPDQMSLPSEISKF